MLTAIRTLEGWFEDWCFGAGHGLTVLFRAAAEFRRVARKWGEIINQSFKATFGSLAITFLTGIFTGMILALQTGIELAKYGQESSIGYVVSATMCREMGPVMTGIAIAGLMGSTYAAELGTMKVNEEIDALEVMSIDPIYYLVMPRVIALTLACVCLTIFTNSIGIIGGALVGKAQLNVALDVYFHNAFDALKLRDIYGGLLKSTVFGVMISTVACSQGLRAENGAEGVGTATLRTVVWSFIFILMFDYFLTWMLY
jgi:phospholipid/cholesterol/gamma-HCH transport system permease protein